MAYLEIETSEGSRRVALDRDRLSVGRLAYNDIVLPFGQISRQHAELRLVNGQWWIADLHSTNGLHVDSRRIQEHALRDGDTVTLAPGVALRFVAEGVATPMPPASGAVGSQRGQPPTPARPFAPPDAAQPVRPRTPFSSDETPYVPPGMARTPSRGAPLPSAPSRPEMPSNGSMWSPPPSSPSQGAPTLGPALDDPYRRNGPASPRRNVPTSPVSTQLHVCQTCGQRTAPDAVFCQSCHQSIARECPVCRLSLLPVQDRCPRCHTLNDAYVGKPHPGR